MYHHLIKVKLFHEKSNLFFCLFCFRREAVSLHLGRMRLAFCAFRRTHTALQKAHGSQTLQMYRVQPMLLTLGPLGAPHEKAPKLSRPNYSRVCLFVVVFLLFIIFVSFTYIYSTIFAKIKYGWFFCFLNRKLPISICPPF